MEETTSWRPDEYQKAWLLNMIFFIRDGGTWAQSVGSFTLDKKTKTATFVPSGIKPDEIVGDIPAAEMYRRNVVAFEVAGWKVVKGC